jgi:CDP-glucose 4,6-dehydratase
MHYLITGHTGFKGSWLSLMLKMQGHMVSGISLNPEKNSLFTQSNLSKIFKHDLRMNILNAKKLNSTFRRIDPEVVIHLAAQPLVLESYKDPIKTYNVNLFGTLNVLQSTRVLSNLKSTLIITTDKVYRNNSKSQGYIETDDLAGIDPYSASKAAADIASQVWAKNYSISPVAVARAGNVIGGGDWAKNRIIPDLVRAFSSGQVPLLRQPMAIRPWQHVLDCLFGYIKLIDNQIKVGSNWSGAWNFGPDFSERKTVSELVQEFRRIWGISDNRVNVIDSDLSTEVNFLLLDSSKSRSKLNWTNKLNFNESIKWTGEWYINFIKNNESIMENQITNYYELCGV